MSDNCQNQICVFSLLFDALPFGIAIWNYEEVSTAESIKLLYVNSEASNLFHLNKALLAKSSMARIIPEPLITELLDELKKSQHGQICRDVVLSKKHYTNLPIDIHSAKIISLDDKRFATLFNSITEEAFAKEKRKLSIGKILETLTEREVAIMEKMIKAKTSKDIARELTISLKTVEIHRKSILRKMNVSSTVELTALIVSYNYS